MVLYTVVYEKASLISQGPKVQEYTNKNYLYFNIHIKIYKNIYIYSSVKQMRWFLRNVNIAQYLMVTHI